MNAWELPGPRAYLEEVANHLTRRRVVTVTLAPCDTNVFLDGLRSHLDFIQGRETKDIYVGDDPPEEVLAEYVGDESLAHNLEDLSEALRDFAESRAFCFLDIPQSRLKTWGDFATNYGRLHKNRPDNAVPMVFVLQDKIPVAGITAMPARPMATEEDAVLFATLGDVSVSQDRSEARLRASIAGVLAQWDLDLAKELVCKPLDCLCDPVPLLKEIAEERCWTPETGGWLAGMTSLSGDLHSAWCALTGNETIIERRLWSAQATVLFPLLENARQSLQARAQRWLKPAQRDQVLELADIDDQLRINNAPRDLCNEARQARHMRNDLAHLKCIRADQIKDLLFTLR